MLQALQSDYVRTARAKGLRERAVIWKHAMRNALTPVITLGALEFGTPALGGGAHEQIFSIPGFGKLIVDAVFNRDYAVVQGRRAGDGLDLHRPEPAGRSRATSWSNRGCAHDRPGGSAPGRGARSPSSRAPGAGLAAPEAAARAPWRPSRSSSSWRCSPPWLPGDAPRSDPAKLVARCAKVLVGPLVRDGRGGAGHPLPDDPRRRASLAAGVISVCIAMGIGIPLGLAAGYLGAGSTR
jgi:hypothetical protein